MRQERHLTKEVEKYGAQNITEAEGDGSESLMQRFYRPLIIGIAHTIAANVSVRHSSGLS
jgi:hypothetical protein